MRMVLGAEYPPISRIRNEYIKHILLKIPLKLLSWVKEYILRVEQRFFSVAEIHFVQGFFMYSQSKVS